MTAEGAVLIEVLPENEYAEGHIAGAVNIPQRQLTPQATARLAKDAALVVYCYDTD
jgi:rhodanese-related sulfurtransferase